MASNRAAGGEVRGSSTFRNSVSVTFDAFDRAVSAVHQISQTGLYPSNCRLLDANEALTAGAGDGSVAVLLIAFESADHSLDAWMARALECCRDNGGLVPEGAGKTRTEGTGAREGSAGAWRQSFVGAPYLRDALVGLGLIIGLAGSLALTRLIKSGLYGVTATDPATYVGISLLLLIVAMVACLVPVIRAVRVDPTIALRYE